MWPPIVCVIQNFCRKYGLSTSFGKAPITLLRDDSCFGTGFFLVCYEKHELAREEEPLVNANGR